MQVFSAIAFWWLLGCPASSTSDHTGSEPPTTQETSDTAPPTTRDELFHEPCGMYVLATQDSSNNIRDADWVAGYVLRSRWETLELEDGTYDFSAIDAAIERLDPLGQKLTVQMIGAEPPYVVDDASDTWVWFDPNPRHTGDCVDKDGCVRVLPWDVPTQERRRALLNALAAHSLPLGDGTVPLADHPALDGVMIGLRGWGRVRELGFQVEDWPNYDRDRLVEATVSDIVDQAEAFPHSSVHVQIWPVRDGVTADTELWEDIQAGIPQELRHRVGYLQENLAHRVEDGTDVFVPATGASPLLAAKDETWTGLQMLTSFARPTPGQETQVASGSPVTAMRWSLETHGARYFEIYVPDVDQASEQGWETDLAALADELCETLD